jgi:hypothetical protein
MLEPFLKANPLEDYMIVD